MHRLDPLLRPGSIAIVGASVRPRSVGNCLVRQLRLGGFRGPVFPVNPRYLEIEGLTCYPTLAALPQPVEHVAFAVADERIEQEFSAGIAHGMRAATIVSALVLPEDRDPPLKERIHRQAKESGILICGGNGMGFYNFGEHVWVCGFETRTNHRAGGIVLLTHSGSLFTALVDSEERIDYALAVSTGHELTTTIADYMDFALDQPQTRAIGLFLETARDPRGFEAALAKANGRRVPVVALKIGRTAAGARLAESHSGALVGNDGAYRALFERYGVGRVRSIDELAAALMVMNVARDIGPGGLATTHDSGGERGLMVDLADEIGVRFGQPAPSTVARLAEVLDYGLPPVNPLDHWGTARNYPDDFREAFRALMADPDTALGAVVLDRAVGGAVMPDYLAVAHQAHREFAKPTFIVTNHQGSGAAEAAVTSAQAGIPVIDGVPAFLKAVRLACEWRDFKARPAAPVQQADPAIVERWRTRLAEPRAFDEIEAMALLADFGLPVAEAQAAENLDAAVAAAERIGYPVVLKTAMPGIVHKSDVGGVRLWLRSPDDVVLAYRALSERLGLRVVIAGMVEGPVVEMILGAARDADFGPLVVIGTGGIHAEAMRDVVCAKPPFDTAEAHRLIDRLKLRVLLDGVRGAPPSDIAALAENAARFSMLAAALGDSVDSIDVNPVQVRPQGCVAVDAVVTRRGA